MRILKAPELAGLLDYETLVNALEDSFKCGAEVPSRHHHTIQVDGALNSTLLLMPAWNDKYLGVKTVMVMPQNAGQSLPSVQANYQLMDLKTGELHAILDGNELTLRRTAAASALASRYLSRKSSKCFLMIGTGALAPHLIRAHFSQRKFQKVKVWGRRIEKAKSIAAGIDSSHVRVEAVDDLEAAVAEADIISTATLATNPLVFGEWLRPGQHIDLVGGFTPDMREADDETIRRARVFVDTDDAIMSTGDICRPIERGLIERVDIQGTLSSIVNGEIADTRLSDDEITLFKSAGTAIEDLAGAVLAYERAGE